MITTTAPVAAAAAAAAEAITPSILLDVIAARSLSIFYYDY